MAVDWPGFSVLLTARSQRRDAGPVSLVTLFTRPHAVLWPRHYRYLIDWSVLSYINTGEFREWLGV